LETYSGSENLTTFFAKEIFGWKKGTKEKVLF
jgi:hypothetical protein